MDYAELRERRSQQDVAQEKFDFETEKKEFPLLHSGFTEPLTNRPEKNAFMFTIYFQRGQYVVWLQDRQNETKAFINVGTLIQAFAVVEQALLDDTVDWVIDRNSRERYGNR